MLVGEEQANSTTNNNENYANNSEANGAISNTSLTGIVHKTVEAALNRFSRC